MILDGKVTAAALEKDIRERIDVLKERGCTLKLAVILAGSSKPSHMYAEFMKKAALSYGIGTEKGSRRPRGALRRKAKPSNGNETSN